MRHSLLCFPLRPTVPIRFFRTPLRLRRSLKLRRHLLLCRNLERRRSQQHKPLRNLCSS